MDEERKARWKREVGWLVSVTDYIVEFIASEQKGKDGSNMEVSFLLFLFFNFFFFFLNAMNFLFTITKSKYLFWFFFDLCKIMVTQQRKDLLMNIPALRKLDTMLIVRRKNTDVLLIFCVQT